MIARTTTAPSGAVLLAWLICAFAIGTPVARAAITIEVSPLANLTYQLDCIADVPISCGARETFRALWRGAARAEAGDDAHLARWRGLRAKHQGTIGTRADSRPWFDLPERIRRAGFAARSIDEYERFVALLTDKPDAAELAAVVAAFRPRFDAWWQAGALQTLERHVRALTDALATPDMRAEVAFIEAFYRVPPGTTSFVIYAIHQPATEPGFTTAQQLGEIAVAELTANDSIQARLPVLVHEYAHFLYSRLPDAEVAALRTAVIKAGRGKGLAIWGLLDEGLATALGNGRVARRLMGDRWYRHLDTERSLYNDPAIDAAGKALLPVVDDAFDTRGSVADAGFADRYAALVMRRLGPMLVAPDAVFHQVVMVADAALGPDVRSGIQKAVTDARQGRISMWSSEVACCGTAFTNPLREHADKTQVIVLRANRLNEATFLPRKLRDALSRQRKPAYAITSDESGMRLIYAIEVAADAGAITRALFTRSALADGVYTLSR